MVAGYFADAALIGMQPNSLRRIRHQAPAPRGTVHSAARLKYLQPGGDDANWWMITLSDLTLLLLGFLVAWYVISTKPIAPQEKPGAAATTAQLPEPRVVSPESVPPGKEWQGVRDEMTSFIGAAGLANEVSVEAAQNELFVSLKDTISFESGKADLRSQALPVLEKLVAMVLSRPNLSLEISGHTDDRPIATTIFPTNWELSAARASRVGRYLIERGVPPSRIAVQGYANHRPRLPNSSAGNRRGNRRVEIRLYYNTDTKTAQPPSGADDRP
ncbi:MAG: flagellar motor protein MotB [Deltaproteobacteria bacterium]|nr:flagellar motor protein MotB [Deltaproteobacteria bacterium]MBI2365968.1 flagellar motor protein MotB [Deltaproteobacteria bacterium]